MKLTATEHKMLTEALANAFPSVRHLKEMLRFQFKESFASLVAVDDINKAAFSIVKKFESEDRILDLVEAARKENSSDLSLERTEYLLISSFSNLQMVPFEERSDPRKGHSTFASDIVPGTYARGYARNMNRIAINSRSKFPIASKSKDPVDSDSFNPSLSERISKGNAIAKKLFTSFGIFMFLVSIFCSIFTYKIISEQFFLDGNLKQISFEGLLLFFACIIGISLGTRLLIASHKTQ